jgi:hypothetical protein
MIDYFSSTLILSAVITGGTWLNFVVLNGAVEFVKKFLMSGAEISSVIPTDQNYLMANYT